MMEPHWQNPEEMLLDYHLDRLGEADRAWLKGELDRDPELREKNERLGQILRPLDHWTVPPAPSNLPDRVLSHLVRSEGGRPASTSPPGESGYSGRSFPVPLREIIAVAACIALLASVFVPGVVDIRSRAQRAMCASNLGSVCQGTRFYQQVFGGSLPFAGSVAGASWLPEGGIDRPYASNSRHIFLLAKGHLGPKPEDFVCPGSKTAKPMRADDLSSFDDFPSQRNNSYASLNFAGADPNVRPTIPIAYASDANPLFRNGRFVDSVDPNTTNSRAHGGRGQTVMTLDGSVRWLTTPLYGSNRDNLWLAGDIRSYTGTEAPAGKDDAQLVPGYPTTDPALQHFLKH